MEGYIAQELRLAPPGRKHLTAGPFYGALFPRLGGCVCLVDGQRRRCDTESIVLLPPGGQAVLEVPGTRAFAAAWLRFSPALLARLSTPEADLVRGFSLAPGCAVVSAAPEATLLIKHLLDRLTAPDEGAFGQAVFERGLLEMLLVLLLRACIADDPHHPPAGRRRLPIDDICVFLRAHLAEDVTLERLASEFYVSPEHLAREFRRRTGETVHGYLTKLRLGQCRRLLDAGRRLSNIYAQCGFASPGGLRRAFCKEFGITPGAYCRQRSASEMQLKVAHSQTRVGGSAGNAGVK